VLTSPADGQPALDGAAAVDIVHGSVVAIRGDSASCGG